MGNHRIEKLFSTALFTALALISLPGGAEPVARKFIGTGWDTLRISPEEVLANAPAFADSGLDGINLCFSTRDAAGNKLAFDTVMSRTAFSYDALKKYVPTFRKIAACPGLKESLLTVWWTPKKDARLDWADDAAWRTFAGNMSVMARLAKEGGLKGLFLDWEDYSQSGQFRRTEADPSEAETLRLARQRGREIGKAVFDAFPDVVFFSYWWLSASSHISELQASERAFVLRSALWPAFFNGMLDVMPDGARLVDGREHYHLESSRRDFYRHASVIQTACQGLVAPENRAKYRRAISVSFGHYIDMYVNDASVARWYFDPEGGSRLEHFRRNVEQSARAATEYVWIYGEKGLFVPLKGCSNGWVANQKPWEELLPGWQEAVKGVKRATVGAEPAERKSPTVAGSPSATVSPGLVPKAPAKPAAGAKAAYDAQGDVPKKFIATGGCVEGLAPKDLLAKGDSFASLGLDGVAVPIIAVATTVNREEANCPTRAKLFANSFRPYIPDLRKMAAQEGLKESLLYVDWSPSKVGRMPWGAAPRWTLFAQNMGLLAQLARASGLKGLFIDTRDRNETRQFAMTAQEKSFRYETLLAEARAKGRLVGKAIFTAHPNIVLMAPHWFSAEVGLADVSRTEAEADRVARHTLWPSFVNGLLDVMPATARLVDCGGDVARDAQANDFLKAASDLYAASYELVEAENAEKLRTVLSVAAGESPDRHAGDVEGFRRNLAQAAATAAEYVWIDAGAGALPPVSDAIRQTRDERGWIRDYLKANAGKVRDLVPDPACAKGVGNGYFAYIDRKIAPDAVIDTDTTAGEGDSVSFRLKGCKDGTLMFRVQGVKPGDVYIMQFSTKGVPVHAKASWREDSQFRWNVPSVGLPVAIENAAGWREASRLVRAPDMAGYNEMYLMIDTREAKDDDVAWVDNVHVYRVSRRLGD